jgi:hypothetical protein
MSLLDDASLLVTPNARKEGKLYSIIPTNGNGDFSVTRATTATRVNAAGLVELVPYNLLTYSEMFSNAAWTKAASSVTPNITTAPNGTLTADSLIEDNTNAVHQTIQSTPSAGGVYTSSVYLKPNGRNWVNINIAAAANYGAWFDLQNGVTGTIQANITSATITSVGDGWYRCTLTANTGAIAPRMSLTLSTANNVTSYLGNGTSGVFLWGAQLVEGTSALDYQMTETRLNIPRLDYSLGSCPNILLEPQRTNLNTFSEEFNNATFWLRGTGVSVNANTSNSPSGTLTADTITGATGPFVWTGAGTFFRAYTGMSVSTAYTFSAYLKGTGSVTMTWRDGTTGGNNSLVCNLTSSWQRFEISRTTGAASTGMAIVFHSASGNFDAWGGQMELGAYATSYIPTTSASVTRNADVISRGNIFTNGLITASGGTWFVDLRNNRALIRDGGASELYLGEDNLTFSQPGKQAIAIRNNGGGTATMSFAYWNGSAITDQFLITSLNPKIAIKFTATTYDLFVNGVKVLSARPISWTLSNIQFLNKLLGTTQYINSMALFPTPLTDTQCIALTT